MNNRDKINLRRNQVFNERNKNGLCAYCGKNPKKENQRGCLSCASERSKIQSKFSSTRKDRTALYRKRIKQKVILKYGGRCNCSGCNESELLFLTIDHINGDGHLDRKSISGGTQWYMHLLREPIRNDLQVLCYNCNNGREFGNGVCPHLNPTPINLCDIKDLRTMRRFNIGSKFNWPDDSVLLQRYYDEGSRVIADEIGCSISAVAKRLQRRGLLAVNHRDYARHGS